MYVSDCNCLLLVTKTQNEYIYLNISVYTINIQNWVEFYILVTIRRWIFKKIYLQSHKMMYLGIILTKYGQCTFTQNYKTLLRNVLYREITEHLSK